MSLEGWQGGLSMTRSLLTAGQFFQESIRNPGHLGFLEVQIQMFISY
jgi:hypothetical protein